MTEHFEPIDSRGIRIKPGDRVIYGAPVGRSIAMVEAVVAAHPSFTSTGRVRLIVKHRAFGGYEWTKSPETVAVRPDRMTVVLELP